MCNTNLYRQIVKKHAIRKLDYNIILDRLRCFAVAITAVLVRQTGEVLLFSIFFSGSELPTKMWTYVGILFAPFPHTPQPLTANSVLCVTS